MKKTTVYLPEELKERVERVAQLEGKSEADVIREAIANGVGFADIPQPRLPLTKKGLGDPSLAERIDELMESFGR